MPQPSQAALPDGLIAIVKRDCPTCVLIEPVLQQIASQKTISVYTQDDPTFPSAMNPVDDTDLAISYQLDIETVPTLLRIEDGVERARIIGWHRDQWNEFTGSQGLGTELPEMRPGCGSRSVEPGVAEALAQRFGDSRLQARRVVLAPLEDDVEACFDREWSDGLPVVPPTEERVARMLSGTQRQAEEIIGVIPPNQAECTVEKVAINAVMAGCKPEYLPVVIAAVEAACIDEFCMHGVLATTYFSGPIVMVNGPIVKSIGMNFGINALGQGNRANATIGRALQLVIRNVGGGKPGGVDRAALGNPGKYTFCFAENMENTSWQPHSVQQGFKEETSTVTLFAGNGVQPIMDQLSRTPESLARTFAASLRSVGHAKLAPAGDVLLVVSPEHSRTFEAGGWSKNRLIDELMALLQLPTSDLVRGVHGIAEGLPPAIAETHETRPKFRPGGLTAVRVGGTAGMFSAIISGWASSGERGSQPVIKAI
ncbi:MAG: thioredoxin family protein [Chloroflexota bacterium]